MKKTIYPLLLLFFSLNSFSQDTKTTENDGFWFVDEAASFQGGDINTFINWVMGNFTFPEISTDSIVFTKELIQFCVNENGTIDNIIILKSIHPSIDSALIHIIKTSPKWIPAKIDNKPVKQLFVLPINIELQ